MTTYNRARPAASSHSKPWWLDYRTLRVLVGKYNLWKSERELKKHRDLVTETPPKYLQWLGRAYFWIYDRWYDRRETALANILLGRAGCPFPTYKEYNERILKSFRFKGEKQEKLFVDALKEHQARLK